MTKKYFLKNSLYVLLCVLAFTLKIMGSGTLSPKSYHFIENKGQWKDNIKFKAGIPGGSLFIENDGLAYNFYDQGKIKGLHTGKNAFGKKDSLSFHGLKIQFMDAEKSFPKPSIQDEEYYNFYLGNNPDEWASHVGSFNKVYYENIYKGISLDVNNKNNTLKYDFVVSPGSNPANIKLLITGAESLEVKNGSLIIKTSLGSIVEKKPYSYQIIQGRHIPVACEYRLSGDTVEYKLTEKYNVQYTLVIDPELIFSTYSGSYEDNFGYTATFDSEGFLFAAGSVFGNGYPVTTGAYKLSFQGADSFVQNGKTYTLGTDIGITKYDTSGTKLIYSTYLGGNSTELPHSIIVNSRDELLVYGTTGSSNFPVTEGASYKKFKGGGEIFFSGLLAYYAHGSDMFLTKFNKDGTAVLASTYIGGSDNDGINSETYGESNALETLRYNYADEVRGEVEIDKEDNVYVVSCTKSKDFPIIGNSFQPTFQGGNLDGCIVKFNPDLSKIIWSSYLGSDKSDAIYSLAFDSQNNVYVAGGTNSRSFPSSSNILPGNTIGGRADGFIANITSSGSSLIKFAYVGSQFYDQIYFVETDRQNNVYIFGQTTAPDNTYIKNSLYAKPNSGQFISKITPALDSIIWSTAFGTGSGLPNISPTAFLVDICNKIYLSGWGGTPYHNEFLDGKTDRPFNMDVTPDAYPAPADQKNFYLMVLEDDASKLVYGSFFGGNESHEHVDGGTSRFDRKGKIYQSVCAGCGANSDFPHKPENAWSKTNNSSNCNNGVFKFDFKLPIVLADFKAEGCNPIQLTNTSLLQKATFFKWDFGDNTTSTEKNPVHVYQKGGTYKITLTVYDNLTCNLNDSIGKEIYISPLSLGLSPTASPSSIYKNNKSQLQTLPGGDYKFSWEPSATLNNAAISNPVARPLDTTVYTVTATDLKNNCSYQASVQVDVIQIFCGEPDIYIPNAFTPNEDEKNDKLFVRGNNINNLTFSIFDRWGEKVFETKDKNIGWDGFYKNMKVDPGVFVYYLDATCINEEKFFKKGNITLIR